MSRLIHRSGDWECWYVGISGIPKWLDLWRWRERISLFTPTAIGYASSDTAEEQARQKEAWTVVAAGHAVANGLPVVAVNRVGFEADPSGADGGATLLELVPS